MVYRASAQLVAGASWTLQAALLACVGFTLLATGVVPAVAAWGDDGWILVFGVVLVGLGVSGPYLSIELWRTGGRPVLEARRRLRRGEPMAAVEGVASTSEETLRVGDRSFDLAMTTTNAGRLKVDGAYVRATYVPESGLLAIVEVRQ